ncbi:PseudoU-synth-2 domain-containing protein [Mycena chlorophos]|uniref:PseudoU-synth-2 domain-containing protein n=1 Tax=Mycena chlorophos TaxID=658473 RepID=A0A8H6RZA7_MYCCL|nr:PseudoU-synth-2 domain-containing protein [Mycena chlorophos]
MVLKRQQSQAFVLLNILSTHLQSIPFISRLATRWRFADKGTKTLLPVSYNNGHELANRKHQRHLQLIPLSPYEQFRHVISRIVLVTMAETPPQVLPTPIGLKKVQPYWHPYTTMAKGRWLNRELLEVVSTEFRDRSMEYYRYALESGVTTVNGKIARPETILRNGDRIENIVHRHEPPVTSTPVKILQHDVEREFIVVDKPGSIPIHGTGRYFKNTLMEILKDEFGLLTYPVNRLDRLTSGLMILPLSSRCASAMAKEFEKNTVRKEYVARCKGEFPEEEITCEEPLLTVDRQMGLNIVHPDGKPAKTVFKRIRYDPNTDSTVVLCKPFTGRSHQIRVHLQFLGFPIANDPVYSETKIWGERLGKGGIDITPSDERAAPAPPAHLEHETQATGNPESLTKTMAEAGTTPYPKLLPRETGEDIGMGSPVPLSSEAVGVITRLRNMKDEEEDWGRWRDVVFRTKGPLAPSNLKIKQYPANQRRRGKGEFVQDAASEKIVVRSTASATATGVSGARIYGGDGTSASDNASAASTPASLDSDLKRDGAVVPGQENGAEATDAEESMDDNLAASSGAAVVSEPGAAPPPPQLTVDEAVERASQMEADTGAITAALSANAFCPECYLPLHPDPKPEKLYIFLHALRYTTSLGTFETPMPHWAAEGWEWDQGNMPKLVGGQVGEPEFKWQEISLMNARRGAYALRVDKINLQLQLISFLSRQEDRLLVTDPKALQYIYHTSGYRFPKQPERIELTRLVFGRGLLWADGDDHKRHRKVMAPGFSAAEAKAFLPLFFSYAAQIATKWKDILGNTADGTAILDVTGWVSRAALDVIGQAAFDYSFGAMEDADNVVGTAYRNVLIDAFASPSDASLFSWGLLQYMPRNIREFIVDRIPSSRLSHVRHTAKVTNTVAAELVAEKSAALLQGKGNRDIMSLLVKANASENTNAKLSHDELLSQMRTIIMAGHETSANTFAWAVLELARHPDVQSRLRSEIRRAEAGIAARPGSEYAFTTGDIDAMPYFNAVVKEVLRMHPVSFVNFRQSAEDDVLPLSRPLTLASGEVVTELPIPKGMKVILSIAAYNRNKDVFGEDAHVFNPERWLDGSMRKPEAPVGTYANLLTFAGGLRTCIGWRFALLELQAFLIELVGTFEFGLTPEATRVRREKCIVMTPTIEGQLNKGTQLPLRVSLAHSE